MTLVATAFYGALDLFVAGLIAYFADPPERVLVFCVVVGILWIVPLAQNLWALVKFWLGYHVFLKEKLTRIYLAQFHKHKFPSAAPYFDAMHFLSGVMDDDDVEAATKLKAAYLTGELSNLKTQSPFSLGMAATLAFEEAMSRYKA
ncbi:hypothetical protein [Sinorhizobium fredii]|uniref:hypothetical protein n=1 Tax=Rhizobium fredii TaxID=380 RepID=UPI0005B4A8F3|nr:hypothetical protein [Sinorhizobium fredii]